MAIQTIIQPIVKLIDIHKYLMKISEQKTAVIKEGAVDELHSLLTKERKYIQLLEQIEAERAKHVNAWFSNQNIQGEDVQLTVTSMLDTLENERDRTELANLTTELTNTITSLKQQEQLNRDLIAQSMQFIHLSLDMLQPTIQNMNYNKQQTTSSTPKRSVFDSKA
ncbi:flagellar protein FlgN [Virgibacillus sp. W0430]|uniref:flagellar protein FlgN n=1 Tax=Virgibacillus sp. W0430 TaxID=3391580 RepID=UPI003F487297